MLVSFLLLSMSWEQNVGFPGSSAGKNPPAMQETLVQFLCWEDLLEKG